MANTNAPFGFRPSRRYDGAAPNYTFTYYQILSSYSTTIGTGDVVKITNTGVTGPYAAVQLAAASDTSILGVFFGCEYYDTAQQKLLFMPQWTGPSTAAGTVVAKVIDDPNMIFEVQASGAAITAASVGLNAKFTGNGAPNSLTGISTAALDSANVAVTATFPFRIVSLSQYGQNDNTSSYNIVEVKMNTSIMNQTTGI